MRISLLAVLAAALLMMSISPRARADFKVLGTTTPKAPVARPIAPRPGFVPLDQLAAKGGTGNTRLTTDGFGLIAVTFVGTPPAGIEVRNGMGRNVRLADALKQIAPPGWHGFGRTDSIGWFDPNRLVSWKGGRPWTEVLDILANEQDLAVEVDWDRRQLYIGKRVSKAPPSTVATTAALPKPASKPVPPPIPVWRAAAGSTLRTSLQAWSQQAGWTLRWEAVAINYPIVAPLAFKGAYVKATSDLISAYAHADHPLWVCLYESQHLTRVTAEPCANPAGASL